LTTPFNVVTNLDGIYDLDSVEDQILLGHSIFSAGLASEEWRVPDEL
jgi:hypothetical protein